VFLTRSGQFSTAFKVAEVTTKNGLRYITTKGRWSGASAGTLTVNPDLTVSRVDSGVLGSDAWFIEQATVAADDSDTFKEDNSLALGGSTEIDRLLDKGDMRQLKVAMIGEDDFDLVMELDGFRSLPMHKAAAAIWLSRDMGLPGATAHEILEQASTTPMNLIVEGVPNYKQAMTRLMEQEEFEDDYDSDFGVPVQRPRETVLSTSTPSRTFPAHRIGDAWDPAMGFGPLSEDREEGEGIGLPMDLLLSRPPEELAQLAAQHNIPKLFDHGIVGSLTQTYDSGAVMDKYMPKLEAALDCMGRMLFLFYWKPGDYQSMFGADDMSGLENRLLSVFRSYGDLVLTLLKKTHNNRVGSSTQASV
jgi:hypothetical protein